MFILSLFILLFAVIIFFYDPVNSIVLFALSFIVSPLYKYLSNLLFFIPDTIKTYIRVILICMLIVLFGILSE